MEYIDANHNEWDSMWSQLADNPLNNGDQLCLYNGYSWEYMGSNEDYHFFRHACHPETFGTEHIYLERTRAILLWA